MAKVIGMGFIVMEVETRDKISVYIMDVLHMPKVACQLVFKEQVFIERLKV